MKRYQLINNIFGWITFLIAAVVYCSTIEPTASFWDCPEFISTGYRLEIGHPPGAPFFMLTANLFSHFASDATQVASMVNTMSALLSALTILFLFWSITHLTRKLVLKSWDDLNTKKIVTIIGSGLVGSLIYTFSDTFWFSAVEGEVYAYSSAFTAIVFWLILKWEDHADEPHSDRYLVLIMYMTGLSIGVHLLNLLCIPAIVLVYVYRKYPKIEVAGSLIALVLSFILVAAVLYGIIPGIVTVGGWFELFFVNELGCAFNTGMYVYIIALVATVVWAIYETHSARSRIRQNIAFVLSLAMIGIPFSFSHGWMAFIIGLFVLAIITVLLTFGVPMRSGLYRISARVKNTVLLCILMIMVGYSSYAVIVIRSSANPPMDQNSPEDIFTLGTYLSRSQYGDTPLLYGQAYSSGLQYHEEGDHYAVNRKEGAPIYQRKEKASADEKDTYEIVSHKVKYEYAHNMLFPRMWDSGHAEDYEKWMGGIDTNPEPYDFSEDGYVGIPTQFENLRFFLSYQCNFMYWRYFMWNFCGRQNDIQGHGDLEKGNWITGISFIDNLRLGDQSTLPDDLKENKGHNVYYALPLLIGLIGLFWQAFQGNKGIRQFWVVFFLFFMTGLAIVIYLNQTPSQPRERDYAYAGSFYAFAIWCGLGVAAIIDLTKRAMKAINSKASYKCELALASACAVACLFVPVQMASQNWDDHDRSGRYACRDFGQNYLMTLQDEGNPIIFTNGDNDTFPLWYNQDVEGVRTDARVCNLSYLQTDWYIDQMKRPAYDSPALPITWKRLQYVNGANDQIEIVPYVKEQVLEYFNDNPAAAAKEFGEDPFELTNIMNKWVLNPEYGFIPTDTVYVKIDKDAVAKSGVMMAADSIPDKMTISLSGRRYIFKGDIMMLELINNSGWTRPIYVASTVGASNYMNLGQNFIKEGLANRITPFTTSDSKENALPGMKNFDTEKTYENMMNRYKYGNVSMPGIYLDETVLRMCYTHRRLFAQLAYNLALEGKTDKAKAALARCEKELPYENIPGSYLSGAMDMAKAYAQVGDKAKAVETLNRIWKYHKQYATWYLNLTGSKFRFSVDSLEVQIYILNEIVKEATEVDLALSEKYENELNTLYDNYIERQEKFFK